MAIFEGERIFGMLTILLVRRDSVSRAAFHPGVRSVAECMSFGRTFFRLPTSAARNCCGGCRRRNARGGNVGARGNLRGRKKWYEKKNRWTPRAVSTRPLQQGGVCIKHGAILVKRKYCSQDGCGNLSQQGGVCIKHGARVKPYRRFL